MTYLIDTCVLSELMRQTPNRQVLDWFDTVEESSIFVSLFSVGELRRGILRLPVSKRREALSAALDEFVLRPFAGRFVSWNLQASEIWARIYAGGEAAGRCPSLQDSIIAATALSHGMAMVTRNVADFQFAGLTVINPFEKNSFYTAQEGEK